MSFLSGIFLWALPLAAAPVIIHLLHRRRRLAIKWGAMQFLLDAATRRRRMWRVEDLLLMLLRAALLALFIFALAGPMLTSGGGGSGPRDVIIVLDTSMSTARKIDRQEVFARQIAKCNELVEDLHEGDFVRLLAASSTPKWLATSPVPVNDTSKSELRSRLSKLTPSLGAADMLRCVREALAAQSAAPRVDRVIAVVTDGQANSWRPEAAKAWRSLAEEAKSIEAPCAINVADVGPRGHTTRNISVESVTSSRYVTAPGRPVTLAAKITNTGEAPLAGMLANWSAEGEPLGAISVIATEPSASSTIKIEHVFATPGVYEVACTLDAGDDLAADDTGRCVIEVVDELSILVVAADVTLDPTQTDVGYLLAAMGYKDQDDPGDHTSVFSPTLIAADELAKQSLQDFHCVVLSNVSSLGPEGVTKLVEYVRSGGGLWIALGDQTDQLWFNNVLHAGGRVLAPLAIEQAVGDKDERNRFTAIVAPDPNHPVTGLLADTQRLDLDRSQVYRRFTFQRSGAKDVAVLLATDLGEPVAVERACGDGRVIVQGLPLSVRWSNLPLLQAYVALVQESLWRLAEPSLNRWNLDVGEALAVKLRPGGDGTDKAEEVTATVTAPDAPAAAAAVTVDDTGISVAFRTVQSPGVGKLELKGPNWRVTAPFYVRPSATESDLTALTADDKKLLTEAGTIAFAGEALRTPPDGFAAGAGKPIWTNVLWWLLVAMGIELILAAALNRKRSAPAAAVSMEGSGP